MKNGLKLAALISLSICGSAFAGNAQHAYVNVLGGVAYVNDSELKSVQLAGAQMANPSLSSQFTNGSIGFTGRASTGYYIYNNPETAWAYGLELGYDYLSPTDSSVNSLNQSYLIKSKAKSMAQAGDFDFIINKGISARLSVFGKLGLAYEAKTQTVNSNIESLASSFSSSSTKNVDGFGALGGLGLQYALTKNIALQAEFDMMKGGTGIGYDQALVGLSFNF